MFDDARWTVVNALLQEFPEKACVLYVLSPMTAALPTIVLCWVLFVSVFFFILFLCCFFDSLLCLFRSTQSLLLALECVTYSQFKQSFMSTQRHHSVWLDFFVAAVYDGLSL
jgi:hypothetical protein